MIHVTTPPRFVSLALCCAIGIGLSQHAMAVDHRSFFEALDAACKQPSYEQCLRDWDKDRQDCRRREKDRRCMKRANKDHRRCKLRFNDRCLSGQVKWLSKIGDHLYKASQHSDNVEGILQACVDDAFRRAVSMQRLVEHCVRVETAKARAGSQPALEPNVSIDIRCAESLRCEDMSSRVEATYHFTACGLTALDRDRNGVPCDE